MCNGKDDGDAKREVRSKAKKRPKKKKIIYDIPARFQDTMDLLKTRWPEAFSDFAPLEIGVREKILQAIGAEHEASISEFLRWYTSSLPYCEQVLLRKHRVRLDGTQADRITKADKQFAIARLYKNVPPRGEQRKKRKSKLIAPQLSPELLALQQDLGNLASRWSEDLKKTKAHLPGQGNRVGDLAFVGVQNAYLPALIYHVRRTENGDMVHWISADGTYGRILAQELYIVPPERAESSAVSVPRRPEPQKPGTPAPDATKASSQQAAINRFGSILRLKKKDPETPATKPS